MNFIRKRDTTFYNYEKKNITLIYVYYKLHVFFRTYKPLDIKQKKHIKHKEQTKNTI